MDKFLDKKYKLVRVEKTEDLLYEKLGMSIVIRKLLPKLKTKVQLVKKGDEEVFLLQIHRKFFPQAIQFEPSVEFTEKTLNGKKVKSIITFQDNIMTHTQQCGEKTITTTRSFFDDEMVETIKYGETACTCCVSHMEQFLNKIYKLEKSENFDAFLKASAITGVTKKVVSNLKPKVVLTRNKDGSYCFSSTTGIIKTFYNFKLNEEFEEIGIMRDRARSVVSFHGNTMVHVQRGVKEVKFVREFSHEKMIMTIYIDDQVCRRYFKPYTK